MLGDQHDNMHDEHDTHDEQDSVPGVAIRRHTDRCFLKVEELAPHGYIVEGIFIDEDDVAEVRTLDDAGRICERSGDSSSL